MAKGKPGGGGGGFTTVRGTNGNDPFSATPASLLTTIYDGRNGFDTLTVSSGSQNVSISVNNTNGTSTSWVAINSPTIDTTQLGLNSTLPSISTLPGAMSGTITNIEKIVTGAGSDRLEAWDFYNNVLDAGAGNDYLSSNGFGQDILIGGAGVDYLRAYNTTVLVGGAWNGSWNDLPDGDGSTDRFQNSGVILDFEPTTGSFAGDRLVFEGSPNQVTSGWYETSWTDPTGMPHDAIAINGWRGDVMFVLVGLTLGDVPNIQIDYY